MPSKCSGCKTHPQELTSETWTIVMKYKSKLDKEHHGMSKFTKNRVINYIITEFDKLMNDK